MVVGPAYGCSSGRGSSGLRAGEADADAEVLNARPCSRTERSTRTNEALPILNGLIDRPLQRSAIPQMHLAQASSRPQRNHKYYRLDPSGLLTLDRFAVTWRSSSVPARRKVCRFTAAGAARVML